MIFCHLSSGFVFEPFLQKLPNHNQFLLLLSHPDLTLLSMRPNKLLSFLCLALSFCLVFCKKDTTTAVTPPPNKPSTDTIVVPPKLHMNLSYLLRQSTITGNLRTNYELLVSESGGKILFDTVTDYNKMITGDLQTSAKLVDVSVIYPYNFSPGQVQFFAYTYKYVDLANWKNVPLSDSVPGVVYPVVTGTATLKLMNVGTPTPFYWQFMSNTDPGPIASPEGISYSNQLVVTYPYQHDEYAYLAFPYAGLYKLHKILGTNDSVDLSTLDTAVKLSFNWPSQYNINTLIYGYLDSNDLSKSLLLAPGHGDYTHNFAFEAMYPGKKYFQKYDLVLKGNPAVFNQSLTQNAGIRWSYLDTIALNIPFPDESYYSINSKTPDSFSVNFPREKPTYYTFSSMFGGANNFLLTVPADSTVLHPRVALKVLLQGKLLKGLGSLMFVNGFTFAIDDDPNYQSYMTKEADATRANKRPLSNQKTLAVGVGGLGGAETRYFFQQPAIPSRLISN